jgi:hypothetical protein
MQMKNVEHKWTVQDIPSQEGRLAVVTGARSGIGFHTAKELARKKATVIMPARVVITVPMVGTRPREIRQPPSRLRSQRTQQWEDAYGMNPSGLQTCDSWFQRLPSPLTTARELRAMKLCNRR